MFCSNCGNNITDQTVCPYCGCPVDPSDYPEANASSPQPYQGGHGAGYEEPTVSYYAPLPQDAPAVNPPYGDAPYQGAPAENGYDPYQRGNHPQSPVKNAPYPDNAPQSVYPGAQVPPVNHTADTRQFNFDRPPIAPAAKPKKKKKGLIIGIVSGVVVVLAGAAVAVYFLFLQPLFSYNKAVDLKDDGKYQEAITAFTDLKDYKDSPEQITECRYLEAKQMLSNGSYDDAIAAFTALGDYKDSKDLIPQCDYERAQKLFDEGNYDKAKAYFESLGDYKDSADRVIGCDYTAAKALMESDPESAVEMLEELGDYQDCKDLIKQAKMNYCQANKSNTDTVTFEYLKDLKAISYPGASALYDELYTYHLTDVFWNTDPDNYDSSSGVTTLSKDKKQVLHFILEGGTPDDTGMQIQYTITWPGGNTSNGSYDRRYHEYSLTMTNGIAGKLKVDIYTQDNTHLYTATVTVA